MKYLVAVFILRVIFEIVKSENYKLYLDIWVQCSCLKWRRLPGVCDPSSVAKNWLCCMNPGYYTI